MYADDTMVSATVQQIRQNYPRFGLQLPEGMADDLAQLDARKDEPQFAADPAALRAAVAAARDAGQDPATDETVRTELARQQLASLNLGQLPDGRAGQRLADVLHKHTPAILADLAQVVEQGDAVLARARKAGVNPAEAYVNGAGQRVELWEKGQEALTRITHAAKIWGLLVAAFRLAERDPRRRALALADLTPEQLFALDGRDVIAAARAGHPLSLATPEEYTQRCRRIDQHLAEQEARRERELHTGRREVTAA
ncbi:hypothetical protein GCE86_19665 [Micromonospora terminaliae]|uniref:Uncharacterized protein n=1 Tax=Micromonospora terminaliae TaxID=1914461 RepID=A0AAJ2ZFV0_9ACTN|nr:hypothetical protein [Micromonospora terminaliae]NES28950.1 hypothetical protein [Micromonospora terminaliae]QGL49031.1 hypothetical protein GCE86_19665 [Micromonospora terminaliae]